MSEGYCRLVNKLQSLDFDQFIIPLRLDFLFYLFAVNTEWDIKLKRVKKNFKSASNPYPVFSA